jgi:hypothetical protein
LYLIQIIYHSLQTQFDGSHSLFQCEHPLRRTPTGWHFLAPFEAPYHSGRNLQGGILFGLNIFLIDHVIFKKDYNLPLARAKKRPNKHTFNAIIFKSVSEKNGLRCADLLGSVGPLCDLEISSLFYL